MLEWIRTKRCAGEITRSCILKQSRRQTFYRFDIWYALSNDP